jgi:hypothetical protein
MCLPSVKFRVNPWQMLLLGSVLPSVFFRVFPCLSVAMLLLILPSVKFRVNPWQMLLLGFPLFLPSVANLLLPFTYFLDIKT